MTGIRSLVAAIAALACFGAACSGGGGGPSATSASAGTPVEHAASVSTVTATATEPPRNPTFPPPPTATLAGMYPPGTRTGEAAVDAVIDAMENRDAVKLESHIAYQLLPCVEFLDRWSPQCPAGVAIGTPVRASRFNHCEGGISSDEFMRLAIGRMFADRRYLYGVYQATGAAGVETIVLFGRSPRDDSPVILPIDSTGFMPRMEVGCGSYEIPRDGITWLVPPKE